MRQKFIFLELSILSLLLISISTFAEFKYLDKVIVVDGFYRGTYGAVQQKIGNRYKIKLLPVGTIVIVKENEIQWSTRAQSWFHQQ